MSTFDTSNSVPALISAYLQYRLYKEGHVKSATFNAAKDYESLRRKIVYIIRSLASKEIKAQELESKISGLRVDSGGAANYAFSYAPVRDNPTIMFREVLAFLSHSYLTDLVASTPEYSSLTDQNAFYFSTSPRGGSIGISISYLYYYTSEIGVSDRLRRSSIVGSDILKDKVDFLYNAIISCPKILCNSIKFRDELMSYFPNGDSINVEKRIPLIYMYYLSEHIRASDYLPISVTESLLNLKLLYEANRSLLVDTVYEPTPTVLNDFLFAYYRVNSRNPLSAERKEVIDAFALYIKSLCAKHDVTVITLGS